MDSATAAIDTGWKQRETTSPDRNLAAQVLIQSLLDLHANNQQVRDEAHAFLFGNDEANASVRRYWMARAGIKVNRIDNVQRLSLEQLRRRMDDQPRWRQQRRARFNERTRQAA